MASCYSLNSAAGSPEAWESRKCYHPMDQHRLGSAGWAAALQGKDLGFPVDSELNSSQECSLVAVKVDHVLGCAYQRRTRTVIVPPFCVSEAASWRTVSSSALQCNNPCGILKELQSTERS